MSLNYKFYDTLVTRLEGVVFTDLSILRCVPTLGKQSLILNTPLQTQLPVAEELVWIGLRADFGSLDVTSDDSLLTPPQARLVGG